MSFVDLEILANRARTRLRDFGFRTARQRFPSEPAAVFVFRPYLIIQDARLHSVQAGLKRLFG